MSASKWWYLAPIIFSLAGGIIMFFALRKKDSGMARNGLIIGIIITFLPMLIVFGVIGSLDANSANWDVIGSGE